MPEQKETVALITASSAGPASQQGSEHSYQMNEGIPRIPQGVRSNMEAVPHTASGRYYPAQTSGSAAC